MFMRGIGGGGGRGGWLVGWFERKKRLIHF